MALYGYQRVSTGQQVESGLSLDEQRRQIAAYAEAHRLGAVGHFYEEKGVSGSIELSKRPQGSQLLDTVRRGDTVICSKLDRMFRSARDALNTVKVFESGGISLHFIDLDGDVSNNGVTRLFLTIMGAVAEFERSRIAERQRDAKASARKEGRYPGGIRKFGWRVEVCDGRKMLAEDQTEQEIIKLIKGSGEKTLSDLQAQIKSRFARTVSLSSLSRIQNR